MNLLFAAPVETGSVVIIAILGVFGLAVLFLLASFGAVWLRAMASGAPVGLVELLALRLRGIPVGFIVDNRITAVKSGLPLTIDDLSTHFLAGGNVDMVVQALIAAQRAGIHLDFNRACAIDLATKGTGKNVLDAVKTSVNPRVIDCPNPSIGKGTIDAVAKDGIVIKARARVTVRTNLDRFVGGATEETIIARVGEGIVSTIGSVETYKLVLENPDRISKTVLDKGLDANTAFEILSIDIADVDVGENVGAKLRSGVGTGEHRPGRRNALPRRGSRSPGSSGPGRRLSEGQSRRDGLLSNEESPGRHLHAGEHRQRTAVRLIATRLSSRP
jgi:uncharacterized protein YqfA (UPF0365 family)